LSPFYLIEGDIFDNIKNKNLLTPLKKYMKRHVKQLLFLEC